LDAIKLEDSVDRKKQFEALGQPQPKQIAAKKISNIMKNPIQP
jgi:hypothetical protein